MSVTSRIVIDTKGRGLAALQRRLRAGVQRVLVGVPAGPVDEDGMALAQLAAIHEFGAFVAPYTRVHRQLLRRSERTGRLVGAAEEYEGTRGPGKGMYGPVQRVTKVRNANAVLQLAKHATFADGITIPERPFLRNGVRNNLEKSRRIARKGLRAVADGAMEIVTVLEQIGQDAAGAVKRYIGSGDLQANAPSTVRKKGSSRPLVDTGQLRQAVTSLVETT